MLVVTISLYRVLCYFSSQSGLFWNTSFTFPSPHICLHYSCAWKYPFLLLVSRSCVCMCAQSCLTLCDPMDCSPPGCSVHGISQARILEWIAISYFRGPSQPRDWTLIFCISYIGRQALYHQRHLGRPRWALASFANFTHYDISDLLAIKFTIPGSKTKYW